MEPVLLGDFEHAEMNDGILVTGETDVADFAGLLRLQESFQRPAVGEKAIKSSIRMFSSY